MKDHVPKTIRQQQFFSPSFLIYAFYFIAVVSFIVLLAQRGFTTFTFFTFPSGVIATFIVFVTSTCFQWSTKSTKASTFLPIIGCAVLVQSLYEYYSWALSYDGLTSSIFTLFLLTTYIFWFFSYGLVGLASKVTNTHVLFILLAILFTSSALYFTGVTFLYFLNQDGYRIGFLLKSTVLLLPLIFQTIAVIREK
jgi:hypothetical protein